jgi:hypothetical protein
MQSSTQQLRIQLIHHACKRRVAPHSVVDEIRRHVTPPQQTKERSALSSTVARMIKPTHNTQKHTHLVHVNQSAAQQVKHALQVQIHKGRVAHQLAVARRNEVDAPLVNHLVLRLTPAPLKQLVADGKVKACDDDLLAARHKGMDL